MFLNCPKCESRLQIDEGKAPPKPFKIRCPKCQASVSVPGSTSESKPAEAAPSATPDSGYQAPASAPLFNPHLEHQPPVRMSATASAGIEDLARILDEVLRNGSSSGSRPPGAKRPVWDRRKALICSSPLHRETIARLLAQNDYDVYIAEGTAQALGLTIPQSVLQQATRVIQ